MLIQRFFIIVLAGASQPKKRVVDSFDELFVSSTCSTFFGIRSQIDDAQAPNFQIEWICRDEQCQTMSNPCLLEGSFGQDFVGQKGIWNVAHFVRNLLRRNQRGNVVSTNHLVKLARDLTRPKSPPNGSLGREMGPLISGKSRLVKYYNLTRNHGFFRNILYTSYVGRKTPWFLFNLQVIEVNKMKLSHKFCHMSNGFCLPTYTYIYICNLYVYIHIFNGSFPGSSVSKVLLAVLAYIVYMTVQDVGCKGSLKPTSCANAIFDHLAKLWLRTRMVHQKQTYSWHTLDSPLYP